MSYMYKEEIVSVRSSDYADNKYFKPSAILDFFQQIAEKHSTELGLCHKELAKKNILWVIVKNRYEILNEMVDLNQVIVKTWPKPKNKLYYDREYIIEDLNGNILVKGLTRWVLIDLSTRKILKNNEIDYNGEYYLENNFNNDFEKIDYANLTFNIIENYQVRKTDLDYNFHMNNTKYADIIYNNVSKNIIKLEISYNLEALKDDTINVFLAVNDNKSYLKGLVKEKDCFNAVIEMEK